MSQLITSQSSVLSCPRIDLPKRDIGVVSLVVLRNLQQQNGNTVGNNDQRFRLMLKSHGIGVLERLPSND